MRSAWIVFLLGLPAASHSLMAAGLRVENLRCEYLKNPLGLDETLPRLSWILASDARGQRQTAYQVLAASSPELLAQDKGDVWDSGRVGSDETAHVVYAGKPLGSRQVCFWKVARGIARGSLAIGASPHTGRWAC